MASLIDVSTGQHSLNHVVLANEQLLHRTTPLGVASSTSNHTLLPYTWDCRDELLGDGARRVKLAGVELDLLQAEPIDLADTCAPLSLRRLSLQNPSMTWWRIPHPRTDIVFNAASAFQRTVAPNQALGATLLSPFRHLGIKPHKVGNDVVVLIDAHESGISLYAHSGMGLGFMSQADASCIGYWANKPGGLAQLDQYRKELRCAERMSLPPADGSFPMLIRGVRIGSTLFVQSFTDVLRNALWPVSWDSLTFVMARRHSGLHFLRKEVPPTHKNLLPFVRRTITKRESADVMRGMGWDVGWSTKGTPLAATTSRRPALRLV